MITKRLFVLLGCVGVFLVVAADLRAGPIVTCSGDSPNYVSGYVRSADNGRHPESATVLWNPSGLSALTDSNFRPTIPVRDWICPPEGGVRVLTAGEITTRDAAGAAALVTSNRTAARAAVNSNRELRAILRALVDEINTLRTNAGLPTVTYRDLRQAARAQIAAGNLDAEGN